MPFEGFENHELVDLKALRAARLACHWAAQLPAAVGNTLIEKRPDSSHTALRWHPEQRALTTFPFGESRICRVGIRLEDLTLLLHDDVEAFVEIPLSGLTLSAALERLAEVLRDHVAPRLETLVPRKLDGMPAHPVGDGAPFETRSPAAHRELVRGFENALNVLGVIRTGAIEPGAILAWPHHLDIAFVDTLDGSDDAARPLTVNSGFLPGDALIDEPYWYVTPSPLPKEPELPELPSGGTWNQKGWTGAVLLVRHLIEQGGDDQSTALARFLAAGVAAARLIARGAVESS